MLHIRVEQLLWKEMLMPNWNDVLVELKKEGEEGPVDRVRRKYLANLSKYTKRKNDSCSRLYDGKCFL